MLRNLARRVRARWLDHEAMRQLRGMDERLLADMGTSHDCLADFIRANSQT